MKKAAKKLLTFVMAAAMLIGSVPMSVSICGRYK